MGFFSFLTTDTKQPIINRHSEGFNSQVVYLIDDDGNEWKECNYDGYGTFGGMDIYELIAKMNGYGIEDLGKTRAELELSTNEFWLSVEYKELRSIGIDLFFNFGDSCYLPQIYSTQGQKYNDDAAPLESCPNQGYFFYNI